MIVVHELDATAQQPHFGRLLQLLFEPFPLLVAQHGGVRILNGDVRHDPGSGQRPLGPLQQAAEVPTVEQDHLHPLADRAEDIGVVDALLHATGRVGGGSEEVVEGFLGRDFVFPFAAGVVVAVIVVVPNAHHLGLRTEFLPAR